MIFRNINIDDESLFKGFEYICSDYVFSYIYMYCDLYKLQLSANDKSVIIRSGMEKPYFYMPLGDIEHGIKEAMEYCSRNNIRPLFSKIPQSHIQIFKDFKLKIKEDRNSFDYIYKNSGFRNYEGKKFRKQRNNMSSYLREYSPSYVEDIRNHIEECKAFTKENYKSFDIVNPTLRILDKLEHFDCHGGIVRDGRKIQAFCVYEKICDSTALSHVELIDNSHRGIHAYMINKMSECIDVEYVNKEDDVGMLGLRRFKESYNPCSMIKKYTAYME